MKGVKFKTEEERLAAKRESAKKYRQSQRGRLKRIAYAKVYNKNYRENPDNVVKAKTANKRWRETNREKNLKDKKAHYYKNYDRYREHNRRFYERIGVTASEYAKRSRRANPDKTKADYKRWHRQSFRGVLADYRASRISFDEFNRRLSAIIARLDERYRAGKARDSERGMRDSQTNIQSNEIKTRRRNASEKI